MDIYADVTERIIEQMERGTIPWEKPWVGSDKIVSHATVKGYSILNQILLGEPGEYATFKQVQDEGGRVNKGAKSKLIVFWKIIQTTPDEDGIFETIPFLKYSRVFNINDCDGIKAKYIDNNEHFDNKPIEDAQQAFDGYIDREKITLKHDVTGGAYYRPSEDMIHLPMMDKFISAEAYYDTAFHECVHSTGKDTRLNRNGVAHSDGFGKSEYSKEELIAEIGACSIMHKLGLETNNTFRNNAAYIQNWLSVLKNDKRLLVSATTAATKAVEFIFGRDEL